MPICYKKIFHSFIEMNTKERAIIIDTINKRPSFFVHAERPAVIPAKHKRMGLLLGGDWSAKVNKIKVERKKNPKG